MGILSQRKLSKIASFNVTAYFFSEYPFNSRLVIVKIQVKINTIFQKSNSCLWLSTFPLKEFFKAKKTKFVKISYH